MISFKKRKSLLLSAIAIFAFAASSIVFFATNKANASDLYASEYSDDYSITFTPLSNESGYAFSEKTRNNNNVIFVRGGCSYLENGWGTIANSGGFSNYTKISGLLSITVIFLTPDSELLISYGWDRTQYSMSNEVINNANNVFDFGNYRPSYFAISNQSDHAIDIESIELSYSCGESEMPSDFVKFSYTRIGNNELAIKRGYLSTERYVVIPSSFRSMTVTTIYSDSFGNIDRLVIPDTITRIDDNAIRGYNQAVIYCYAKSQPEGWSTDWNKNDEYIGHIVFWDYASYLKWPVTIISVEVSSVKNEDNEDVTEYYKDDVIFDADANDIYVDVNGDFGKNFSCSICVTFDANVSGTISCYKEQYTGSVSTYGLDGQLVEEKQEHYFYFSVYPNSDGFLSVYVSIDVVPEE